MDFADKKRQEKMKKTGMEKEPCSECGGRLVQKYISQEFEREGVTVKLSGISAWICSKCGDIYFLPGAADKVVEAANSLFALAVAENQHKRRLSAQICRA